VVFVTLGEKSISGIITKPQLAVPKVRGGIAGREYGFATETVVQAPSIRTCRCRRICTIISCLYIVKSGFAPFAIP
jgi:hypothetical protein